MMLRKTKPGEILHGNDRYEGYCKDLTDAITKLTGIKFLIKPVKDGKYGSPDSSNAGGWNGELREREGQSDESHPCRNGGRVGEERGRDRHRPPHHQLPAGAGGGLHQTLHVARHLHHDQGASQTEAGRLHLHESPQYGDLDVCCFRLHRSQHRLVLGQQVFALAPLYETTFNYWRV